MPNPLTQVSDALWTMLEANSGFADLVKAGNRIKYNNRAPEKAASQAGDYPRVRIREHIGECNLHRTSNSVSLSKQYHVQIATGEQAFDSLHDVEWEVLRAFADWEPTLEALEWDEDESKFVKRCDLLTSQAALDDTSENKRIRGWSTVWIGEVEMWFQNLTLKP